MSDFIGDLPSLSTLLKTGWPGDCVDAVHDMMPVNIDYCHILIGICQS
jgi:hypothetical protein